MAYTTIDKPTDHFETELYSGSASDVTMDGLDFQPDWVWLKKRSGSGDHLTYDSVRGTNKRLTINGQDAEVDRSSNNDELKSFNSDGWTLGTFNSNVTGSGSTCVSWNWLASGSTASNTDGSITSTVSANTTAGFSIVSYTGTTGGASSTIGHGLGVTPDLVILKPRSYSGAWWWVQKGRSDKVLELQATNAEVDPSSSFGGGGLKYSTFTSSVFGGTNGTSNDDLWNTSGATYIAYCFAEKNGYSKFGSYTGNGNADGVFVYTGFKPAMVIVKRTSGADRWVITDNKRDPDNPVITELNPNDSTADDTTGIPFDFLSNGFKLRRTGNVFNSSSETYIYMAFAESPFVTSTGIPTTAR